jgi:transcriptional regulator with XRE-family HTH domain
MPATPSPTVLRRQLGAELRRLRERSERTVADVAKELGWSESKLSRIETANSGIRNADLTRLMTTYGVPDQERSRISSLAGLARQRAWWEAYGDALLDSYETYIGFEAEAKAIYAYDAAIVNGLLQTTEYASAIIKAVSTGERPDVISQRVAVRLARQAVLTRDPPPRLSVIMDEAVLRRPIGGPDVMRRQLMRLLEVSQQPLVTIQIVPFVVGAHRGLDGSFSILEFVTDTDHPLAYCDGMTGGVFRSKPDELRRYWMSLEALRASALGSDESAEFITTVMHTYD